MHKSHKEFYRAVAKQWGITCKMSDHCRCLDCQVSDFSRSPSSMRAPSRDYLRLWLSKGRFWAYADCANGIQPNQLGELSRKNRALKIRAELKILISRNLSQIPTFSSDLKLFRSVFRRQYQLNIRLDLKSFLQTLTPCPKQFNLGLKTKLRVKLGLGSNVSGH